MSIAQQFAYLKSEVINNRHHIAALNAMHKRLLNLLSDNNQRLTTCEQRLDQLPPLFEVGPPRTASTPPHSAGKKSRKRNIHKRRRTGKQTRKYRRRRKQN